jgi:SAM-dependent methyltransferase
VVLFILFGVFLRENEVGARIAPHLRRGWRVLDLGAGTGRMSAWLARAAGIRPTLADLVEYPNRRRDLPFVAMDDPYHVEADDRSFDAVLLLFALHHNPYEAQPKIVAEAVRLAAARVVVVEDTPTSVVDRAFNVAWDKVLNLRHGVPTPFAFRGVREWREVLEGEGLSVRHLETYRPMWPTLKTYRHTLFVLDRNESTADPCGSN